MAGRAGLRAGGAAPRGRRWTWIWPRCLRGFVLGEAVQQVGREEAFRVVGREILVKNRNHQKALKHEVKKAEALCKEVGQPVPPVLAQAGGGEPL